MARFGYLGLGLLAAVCLFLLGIPVSASAQYTFNPFNLDEHGARYFGSAKDVDGDVLPEATVRLDALGVIYIFRTDETGRFHGTVPADLSPDKVKISCLKPGFQTVRITKRPGPATDQGPVLEVNCVLRGDEKK